MKARLLFPVVALLTAIARTAWADVSTVPPSPQMGLPPGLSPIPADAPTPPPPDPANGPAIPGPGFDASRYEPLWTKSPFAVATSEDVATESPDFSFVGFAANVAGVSYASLIEKDNNAHFLISTDKPVKGMTLTSINRTKDSSDIYALIKKDGASITLKLEQAAVAAVAQPNAPPTMFGNVVPQQVPGAAFPQMQAPGATTPGFGPPGGNRPFPRIHRAPIHLPPMPGQQPQQVAPPPMPQTH